MYALIISTNRRNKEQKHKDRDKSRNKYTETKQKLGAKNHKTQKSQKNLINKSCVIDFIPNC